MSTSTSTAGPARPDGAAGPTPRVELDLPVALNAIHTAWERPGWSRSHGRTAALCGR